MTYLSPDEVEQLRAGYGSDFYRRLTTARAELRDAIAAVDAAILECGIADAQVDDSE